MYTISERDLSPPTKYEPEKKETKPEKPKFRKPLPPPMDFNQLLKLAEQKKSEPIEIGKKKEVVAESEAGPERLMTKKQKRDYEEEMARRQRRLERLEAERNGGKKGKYSNLMKTLLKYLCHFTYNFISSDRKAGFYFQKLCIAIQSANAAIWIIFSMLYVSFFLFTY